MYKTFTLQDFVDRFELDGGRLLHKKGVRAGKEAGSIIERNGGYRYLAVSKGGKTYSFLAHRIVWALHYGKFAPDSLLIDHIDGNPANNQVKNLRLVTPSENQKNRGKRQKKVNSRYVLTSVTGIKFDKKSMEYVVLAEKEELLRTKDFEEAKYSRWNWEFDNNYTERY